MSADNNREKYLAMLKTAVEEARLGLKEGGIPIGAALFERSGKLLGRGHNRRVQEGDPSAHGETDAFRKAGRQRSYGDKIMITDRKSTRLNSSHRCTSYAVFCLNKKKKKQE